jgi:hypothetical protein
LNIGPRTGILLALVSLTAVTAAFAHHSAAAAYEADESIGITGTVLKFTWSNPHCHVYINVAEGPFKGRTYTVELSSPVALVDDGWNKTTLRPGDDVTMTVHPSRDGAAVGLCRHCAVAVNGRPKKASGN